MTIVRKALGDRTSESDQLFALHSVTATSLDVVRDYAAARGVEEGAALNAGMEEKSLEFRKTKELYVKI